jgi:hypothetical protein
VFVGKKLGPSVSFSMVSSTEHPPGSWCKSGHFSKELFLREDGSAIPMRFFRTSGDLLASEHQGVYCEECVAIANKMAKTRKSGFYVR